MICVNDEITYVSSKQKWFSVNLKEIWKYRDLIILFVKRDLTTNYKQTVEAVTPAAVSNHLKKVILKSGNHIEVIMSPKK